MAAGYQVGTREQPVEIALHGGSRLAGEMFLRPGAMHAESIADRLNDGESFFPMRHDGAVLLVGKRQVRYVVAPPLEDDDPVADQRESLPQLLVIAELDDGEQITGTLFVDSPPGHVRALDYVNGPRRAFVPLAQLDREYLINRDFIRHIRDVRM